MSTELPIARDRNLRINTLVNQESAFARLMTFESNYAIAIATLRD